MKMLQMRNSRSSTFGFWLLAVGLIASPAIAQQPAGPAVPAAPAQAQTTNPYVVGQAKPPVEAGASLRDLSLEQAVQIALENNLDLKVARMNPQIQDYSLVQARAAFRPTLAGNFQNQSSSRVSTNANEGVPSVVTATQTYGSSISQNISKFGGNYQLNFSTNRTSDNTLNSLRPLQFGGNTQISYQQPLLANFKIDSNRNTLRTQQVQRQIVDITLQQTIENTKANVRTAYWALRRSIEQVEIQKRALELSQRLLQDNKTKVEIGTMAPIDVVQNESTVATNEQALLNARIQWESAELVFKRLLVKGTDDPLYGQTINPVDQPPALEEVTVDIPKAVKTALAERTDITTARKQMESDAFTLQLRKNQTLPALNLNATYRLAGTGGDAYNSANGIRTTLREQSGYADVYSSIFQRDQPTWTVSANFSMPLGMQAARAALASARISFQQREASLKATELTVSTDVTNAGLAVQNSYKQLLAARKSAEAAQRNAEAEQTRFDNGMSNNYNVAIALNDLTSRRLAELNAVIAYVNAIADYEKKQHVGTGGGGQ